MNRPYRIALLWSALLSLIGMSFSFAKGYINMDSLLTLARSTHQYDTARLRLYRQYSECNGRSYPLARITAMNEAIQLATKIGDKRQVVFFYLQKGSAFQVIGKRDSAYQCYQEALAIAAQHKYQRLQGDAYNEMARFFRAKEPKRAIALYDKAMNVFTALNDTEGIATIWNESGVAYEYLPNYSEALRRYRQSLALQEQRKDSTGIGYSLEFIGGVLTKMKQYETAETYLKRALTFRELLKDSFALSYNYLALGELYSQMGKGAASQSALNISIALNKKIDNDYGLLQDYESISRMYQRLHQPDSALLYQSKHYEIKDKMFALQKEEIIEELHTRYETKEKELLISQQEKSIANRNKSITLIISFFLLLGATAIGLFKRHQYRQRMHLEQLKAQQQEEASKAIVEIEERERQRIAYELHDGVGQMVSAAHMNLLHLQREDVTQPQFQNQLNKAIGIVGDAYQELRHIAHNMAPYALERNDFSTALFSLINPIDTEVLAINLYTEGLDTPFDKSTASVLYRIIQEAVNNVIKHAQATRFDISLIKDSEGLQLTLEDNGKGFDSNSPKYTEGAGLGNIRNRVQFLKGEIEIDSAPGRGTLIAVFIPV